MTSFRDNVLPALDRARGLAGALGLRQHTATARLETYSGPVGDGAAIVARADTPLVCGPNGGAPRVKRLSDLEAQWFGGGNVLTDATGRPVVSVYRVGPFTPSYGSTNGLVTHVGAITSGTLSAAPVSPAGAVLAGTYAVLVTITTGGPLGVGTFSYALNAGTPIGPQTIPAGGAFVLPNLGVALTFAGSFVATETYALTVVAGGYTPQQLLPVPTDATRQRAVVWLTGPDLRPGGEPFEVVPRGLVEPATHITLTVRRVPVF